MKVIMQWFLVWTVLLLSSISVAGAGSYNKLCFNNNVVGYYLIKPTQAELNQFHLKNLGDKDVKKWRLFFEGLIEL